MSCKNVWAPCQIVYLLVSNFCAICYSVMLSLNTVHFLPKCLRAWKGHSTGNLELCQSFAMSLFSVADFCWRGGSTRPGYQGQQKLKNVCDSHTLKLAETMKICPKLHITWLKWSKWCSKIYYQIQKNGIIFLGTKEGLVRDLGAQWKFRLWFCFDWFCFDLWFFEFW